MVSFESEIIKTDGDLGLGVILGFSCLFLVFKMLFKVRISIGLLANDHIEMLKRKKKRLITKTEQNCKEPCSPDKSWVVTTMNLLLGRRWRHREFYSING